MFRVASNQTVLRISLVFFGLLVCGAVAQDQADAKSTDKATADKPVTDVAGAQQVKPVTELLKRRRLSPRPTPPEPSKPSLLRTPSIPSSVLSSEKQRKKNERAFKQEVSKTYKKWLEEDVVYIITDEERAAFKQLSNDEERDNFIEAFWQRRDPTPDTEENEYKEEHYQRIAYANEHFAAGVPGLEDRSRPHLHRLRQAR